MMYRADIDGLRALAVLLVVAFHGAPDFVAKGFIGVDIFFVISGYLITYIILERIRDNRFSLWWFLSRRIRRLFPALTLVLLFVLGLGWFSLLADEYKLIGKHVVGGAFFVANFLFAAETGYFDVDALYKPLLHLWSLAVEEQFYLFFPVFLMILHACRINILACLTIVFTCSLLYSVHQVLTEPGRAFFLPLARFWELLSGGIMAWATLRSGTDLSEFWQRTDKHMSDLVSHVGGGVLPSIGAATVVSGTGFLLIASALFLVPDGVAYPGIAAVLPVAGAMCIILAGPRALFNRILLMNRAAIWFGLISYPLYLWHWPILSFMSIIDGDLPHRDARLIGIGSSVLLAWITYQFVERHVRYKYSRKAVPVLLLGCVVLIACGGGLVYWSNGVSNRQWLHSEWSHSADKQLLKPQYERGNTWLCPAIDSANCTSTGKEPAIVVIGDSHALDTYAMLRHVYEGTDTHVGLIGHGGCPSLLGVVSHDQGTVDTRKCLQNIILPLKEVIKQAHVKHVVLANRIALYTNGSGFGRKEKGLSGWVFRKAGQNENEDRVDVFFDALHETVHYVRQNGKRVSIVHSTPELGFDIKSCAPLRPYFMKPARKPCAIKRSQFDDRTRVYRDRLGTFLGQHPEIGSADVSSALCDAELCYGAKDGNLYYVDDDHLSGWAATHVSEHVARQLGNLVKWKSNE